MNRLMKVLCSGLTDRTSNINLDENVVSLSRTIITKKTKMGMSRSTDGGGQNAKDCVFWPSGTLA